jgi:hypothetical protein
MKTTKKSKINENALRLMLRKEIVKLLEAEEEQEAPEQEEQPEPEEEPEEEQGLNPKLEGITRYYIRKLKDSGAEIGMEELVEMLSTVIEQFAASSEQKLNILKTIRTNIVH